MNRKSHNNVNVFLSLRRILILSLAISVGFHFVIMIAFFFGETMFEGSEKAHERPSLVLPQAVPNPIIDTLNVGQKPPLPPIHQVGPDSHGFEHKKLRFGRILLQTGLSFVLLFLLFMYNRRIMSIAFVKKWRELFFAIFGSMLITTVLSVLFSYFPTLIDSRKPSSQFLFRMIRDGLVRDYSLTALVIMACHLMRSLYRQKAIAVENEELRTENIRSHYEALKNQLDPHFLFNSMNTLQSLITLDADKAGDYVQQLSTVLRYTLQNKYVVSLAEEMNFVEAYCGMMQIRHGDNLIIDYQIDTSLNDYKVLPLAVQGLVENAIKHNVISNKQPLVIHIVTEDNARIIVKNTIQPKIGEESGSGIGLANLAERYRLQWGKEIEIIDDGVDFKVIIPLIEL